MKELIKVAMTMSSILCVYVLASDADSTIMIATGFALIMSLGVYVLALTDKQVLILYIIQLITINNIYIKQFTMKQSILPYLFGVTLLGTFMGLLMSMGSSILPCIGFSCLFWACMLAPMLGD